jgi:hypothetical protein
MAGVVGAGRDRGRGAALRRAAPASYLFVALAVAVAFLPSALRPPPEQTSDSAALNPDAPPDQDSQVIQSVRQAKGAGAGANETLTATTTTTRPTGPAAKRRCVGNPPRQTESVYSPPCAAGFSGDNGGATGHNVFPNSVKLGIWHSVGAPSVGCNPETAPAGETNANRTTRVLAAYFNKNYQTWGRKISICGMEAGGSSEEDSAEATRADEQEKIFSVYHLEEAVCEDMVRRGGVAVCNPLRHAVYLKHRPGMFSFMMDRDQAFGFGAEWMCKRLIGKPAAFAGANVSKTGPRKIGILTGVEKAGLTPPEDIAQYLERECGAKVARYATLATDNDPSGAAAAVTNMFSDDITTIILEIGLINALHVMNAADGLSYQPEWTQFTAFALDFNIIGRLLPPNQMAHMLGISAWEVPRPDVQQECYLAYRSMDPANTPDGSTCGNFWHPLVMMMNGIQEAGPRLSQKSFDEALLRLGHRYPAEPWAIGGGFGPDDYSYMDDINEIWWDPSAVAPNGGWQGAYRYTARAKRFKRGELTTDASELFVNGVTYAGGPNKQ